MMLTHTSFFGDSMQQAINKSGSFHRTGLRELKIMRVGDLVMKRPDPRWPRPEAWPKLTPGIVIAVVPPPHSPVIGGFYYKDKYHVRWLPFDSGKGTYKEEELEVISEGR